MELDDYTTRVAGLGRTGLEQHYPSPQSGIQRSALETRCPGSSGVEQRTENPRVGGSIPPPGTILYNNNQDSKILSLKSFCEERLWVALGYHFGWL